MKKTSGCLDLCPEPGAVYGMDDESASPRGLLRGGGEA